VVEVELPPLRARPEDVPALAQRFLEQVNVRLGREKQRIAEGALARLVAYDWPGNVRELRNAVEQAAVLCGGPVVEEGDLRLGDVPANAPAEAAPVALDTLPFTEAKRRTVLRFERDFLLRALRAHDGNVSRTAEAIGMVRQSLQQKIRELGLRSEDWSGEDA
jgi:two-component system nitrogen regulation response regulator NtrX